MTLRFPFVASKLLSSKSTVIVDHFFRKPVKVEEAPAPEEPKKSVKNTELDRMFEEFEAQVLLDDSDVPIADATDQTPQEDGSKVQSSPEATKSSEEEAEPNNTDIASGKTPTKEDSEKWEDVPPKKPLTEVNTPALEKLFGILSSSDEINYVLSGYLNSIVTSFIKGEASVKVAILEYFYSSPTLAEEMINHLYCRSIANLLGGFLNIQTAEAKSFDSRQAKEDQEKEDKAYVEERISIFRKLINRALAISDLDVIDNIYVIFEEFLKNCGKIHSATAIFDGIFFHKETLETFMGTISNYENAVAVSKSAIMLRLFSKIVNFLSEKRDSSDDNHDLEVSYFEPKLKESTNALVEFVISNVENLVSITRDNVVENTKTYTSTHGKEYRRLGTQNVYMLELMLGFLKFKNPAINSAIAKTELLPTLLYVFEHYPWNNIFHIIFMKILNIYLAEDAESPLFTSVSF